MAGTNINTFAPSSTPRASQVAGIPVLSRGKHVAVVGAGVFGVWSALHLLRKGFKVTLIDAWGPGNSRSSSGDETRVIRSTYGSNKTYFDLNVRALELWNENKKLFKRKAFYNTGVIWFCYKASTPIVDDSIPFSVEHEMEYEYLKIAEINKRYPLIHTGDLHHAYLDPYGGYLKARESVIDVHEAFLKAGGSYIQQQVIRKRDEPGKIHFRNGNTLEADLYLFACGPWIGSLFSDLSETVSCTRQEVYYFGADASTAKAFEDIPVWIDVDGKDHYYGIPSNANRGFKIGVDIRGDSFDPTNGDRTLNPDTLAKARTFIAHRFPKLKNAPLLEHRVCPYENSSDGNFVFDVHPDADNVVLLGGGSGHGFKHGPALGELVADVIAGEKQRPDLFALKNRLV